MPINLMFDSLEGLPDAMKAVLVERDGKFVLEGETVEEVTGLKRGLSQERETTKKLRDDLKKHTEQYKDLDPEKAREALKAIEELEEKGLRDAGKTEEVFERRLTTARESWEREKMALSRERDQALEAHKLLQGRYHAEAIDGSLREAMGPLVKPEHYADVSNRLRPFWRFTDDGEMQPFREGKDGPEIIWGRDPQKPISMTEQIETLLKEVPVFALPSSGGGAANGGFGGRPGTIVLSREQAKDAQTYRAAKARAEATGAELIFAPT